MSLENKTALVTGATGAIGSAICEELLKNGVKNLAALDLHSDKPKIVSDWSKKYRNSSIFYFQVDVTSYEDLNKCYKEFTNKTKSLDIVVNCAGIFNENAFDKVVNVNLNGVIGSTLLAIEHMRKDTGKGSGGIVLNISSVAGLSTLSFSPAYCASKHGVVAYTRAVAHGRENLGIKFLILCPGATDSELMDKVFSPEYYFMTVKDTIDAAKKRFSRQSPSEVAKAALKLMQDGKSGSVWIINQGELTETALPEIPF